MQPRFERGKPVPIDWGEASRVNDETMVHQIVSPLFMEMPAGELDESDSLMRDIPLAITNHPESFDDGLLETIDTIIDSL